MKILLITLLFASTVFAQVSKTVVGDVWRNAKLTKTWNPPIASGTLSTLGNAEILLLKTLITPVISGGTLSNAAIVSGTVSGAAISNAQISLSTFNGGLVSGSIVSGASIVGSTFSGTISGATLVGGLVSGASIVNGSISGTSVVGSQISSSTLINSVVSGGTVSGASQIGGTASGVVISNSTFNGGILSGSALVNGSVSGGSVLNSSISSATISNSLFTSGTVTSSTVINGVISGAAITGGTISGTVISGISVLSNVVTLTASTTLTNLNDTVYVNSASGTFTVTLPAAASSTGKIFTIIQVSSSNAAIVSAAATVCSRPSIKMIGFQDSVVLESNGSAWLDKAKGCARNDVFSFFTTNSTTACTAGTCTTNNFVSNGSSPIITRGGAGTYSIGFPVGQYGNNFSCQCTSSIANIIGCHVQIIGTTSATILSYTQSTGSLTDGAGALSCTGPR